MNTSARVSQVQMGGRVVFVRNGIVYKDLERAVQGNPLAEQAARRYSALTRSGKRWLLGGVVVYLAGLISATATLRHSGCGDEDESLGTTGMWVLAGSGVAVLVGAVAAIYGGRLVARGQPYSYDAVNLFNDSLDTHLGEAEGDSGSAAVGIPVLDSSAHPVALCAGVGLHEAFGRACNKATEDR